MSDKKTIELLQEIDKSLKEIVVKNLQVTQKNTFVETYDKLLEVGISNSNWIKNSLHRINSNLINITIMLIATYLVIASIPRESIGLPTKSVLFPLVNLLFLFAIDLLNLSTSSFILNSLDMEKISINKYSKYYRVHMIFTILSFLSTMFCLGYLVFYLIRI